MSMIFDEEADEHKPTHIIRDRDTKFIEQLCAILESGGMEFRPIPARSPNLNPVAESWVGRTRGEVLNHFIVFGEKHLRRFQGVVQAERDSSKVRGRRKKRQHRGRGTGDPHDQAASSLLPDG